MAYVQVSGKIYDTCPSDGKVMIDERFVSAVSEHYLQWTTFGYVQIIIRGVRTVHKQLHNFLYELHTGKPIPCGKQLHHINYKKWDDRVENLELTTCAHNNAANDQKTTSSTSDYKGVNFDSRRKKWKAAIRVSGKKIHLGLFSDELDAAKVYDKAFLAVHRSITGSNGLLNPAEIKDIQEHRERYSPCPKRDSRELPDNVSRDKSGYKVQIRKQDLQFYKYFTSLEDAIFCANTITKQYNDDKEAEWLKTPIARDEEGVAIVKVKKPNVDEYVNARVDDEDWHKVARYKWYLWGDYAKSDELGKMHTYILPNTNKSKVVDHINSEKTLDNRKYNLRVVSHTINGRNKRKRKDSSSQYIGVSYYKKYKKWRALISNQGKRQHLGYFDIEEDARDAYETAKMQLEAQELAAV